MSDQNGMNCDLGRGSVTARRAPPHSPVEPGGSVMAPQAEGTAAADATGTVSETEAASLPLHADGAALRPRVFWLGGWGVAPQVMQLQLERQLPFAEHRVYAPTAENLEQLRVFAAAAQRPFDFLGGYSTGAFLLLREVSGWGQCPPLRLFAPFFDFRAEAGLGGRVVATRLKLLLRRLRSAPLEALADFYQQSGIALPPPQVLPYAAEDLVWGIEQLAHSGVTAEHVAAFAAGSDSSAAPPAAPHTVQPGTCLRAWIGGDDALLDGGRIASLLPACRLLPTATHDLGTLLAAALGEGGVL